MKISAIISEYNPLHLGHKYQIDTLKSSIDTSVISIMSGDFVQRGECAILDKYKRAELAIKSGVNLVIELPYFYSLQSAENFAKGSVEILNKLSIVDFLCFGYECESKDELVNISNFQIENREKLNVIINNNMKNGLSYAVAYKDACLELANSLNIKIPIDFFISNNILALEYIKNLKFSNSKINIFPIKRKGQNYNSEDYNSNLQLSATSIRNAIYNNDINLIKNFVSKDTIIEIEKITKNKNFQDGKKTLDILKFMILTCTVDESKIVNYENGILNLIKNNIFKFDNFEKFIDSIQSKRYKKVRIKRFLMNYILNVTEDIKKLYEVSPTYIKVLAFDEKGMEILRKIKNNSELKIITKNKDSNNLSDTEMKKFELENNARKIYKLLTNNSIEDKYINYFIER